MAKKRKPRMSSDVRKVFATELAYEEDCTNGETLKTVRTYRIFRTEVLLKPGTPVLAQNNDGDLKRAIVIGQSRKIDRRHKNCRVYCATCGQET